MAGRPYGNVGKAGAEIRYAGCSKRYVLRIHVLGREHAHRFRRGKLRYDTSRELPNDPLERALALEDLLLSRATGGDASDEVYRYLRREFMDRNDTRDLLPSFVRTCRTLGAFWGWIKGEAAHWEPRRVLIRAAFVPLLDHLEGRNAAPPDKAISEALENFDAEGVHRAWAKALDRRGGDPEGAITMARTLLETTCKRILEECAVSYSESDDLPKLYRVTAETLRLAPNQFTEPVFKAILGACHTLVSNLGTLRNKIGDAHGKGRPVKVAPRHAALAVHLAGATAVFLAETHADRKATRERAVRSKPYLDEIRSRLTLSTVVARKVRLKRAGREWKGLSPFNAEKTPSFYVNDQKGFYHCFASGKHGDVFTFLMETEGLSFPEAVERLGNEAGVSPPSA